MHTQSYNRVKIFNKHETLLSEKKKIVQKV